MNKEQFENLPDNIKNMGLVPLSQWNKYFAYPKTQSLRQLIFRDRNPVTTSDKTGVSRTLKYIGSRVYVDYAEFFKWIEEQNTQKLA